MVQAVYNHADSRLVCATVNEIVRMLDSAVGTITLTNGATTTTVQNAKITTSSRLFLQARNANAASSAVFIQSITNGSFVIGHPNASTERTFDYLIFSA